MKKEKRVEYVERGEKKETGWGEEWRKYDIILWSVIRNILSIQESN
jgi:hypothetical protein